MLSLAKVMRLNLSWNRQIKQKFIKTLDFIKDSEQAGAKLG